MNTTPDPPQTRPADGRSGLLAAGNFIVDHVKRIDHWPRQDTLASILDTTRSNGGGPYNVLKDLAAMGAPFPLMAAGLIGADEAGDWIVADCQAAGIGTALMRREPGAGTSFTDAMTVAADGRRTFFHYRGANALLQPRHVDLSRCQARVFYLGYLMLLDSLDELRVPTGDHRPRTGAAEILEQASAHGMHTVVDLVSAPGEHFAASVRAALPWVDTLILNEIEAELVTGIDLSAEAPELPAAMTTAALELLASGVRREVVIHCADGAVVVETGGEQHALGSLMLPDGFSQGATGAGDAFAAGYLWGLHEGMAVADRLRLATAAAAQSLSHPAPSAGLAALEQCLQLAARCGHRRWGDVAGSAGSPG